MTVICLGPCCIPVSAIFPVLFLLLAPFLNLVKKTPLAKYLPSPDAKAEQAAAAGKGCCSDGVCADGLKGSSEKVAGEVTAIASMEQWEKLRGSEAIMIVDFTAGWCKPCQKMAPVFEGLAAEHEGVASFVKVDIDDLPDAFDGVSIPAFHVLKAGVKVDSVSGAGEERLRNMISKHLKKSN